MRLAAVSGGLAIRLFVGPHATGSGNATVGWLIPAECTPVGRGGQAVLTSWNDTVSEELLDQSTSSPMTWVTSGS